MAILWTISLIINIINCINGQEPSWLMVILPMFVLTANYWIEYLDKGDKN